MTLDTITQRARKFWKVASTFPPTKEQIYVDHAKAQEFDRWKAKAPLNVLEYGCGGGSDALSYLRRGHRVVATDISAINVASTGVRIREDLEGVAFHNRHAIWLLTHPDRIAPITGSEALQAAQVGQHLGPIDAELGAKPFDLASAHGVLHHIPQPLVSRVVAEIHRVLRPGGWFYAMLYTPRLEREHAKAMQLLIKRYGLAPEEALGWLTEGEGCPWTEVYTLSQAAALFEPAGFVIKSSFDYADGFFRTYRMVRK